MKIKLLWIILASLSINFLNAKQPSWVKTIPGSEYFFYYIGFGTSSTIESAKEKAISNAVFGIIRSGEITVSGEQELKSKDIEKNGKLNSQTKIVKDILIKGESQNIYGLRKVDEYYKRDKSGFEFHVLIRVPQKKSYAKMPIYQKNKFAPIWRSTIVPGWGQFYKQQPIKGTFIMSSELVFVASTFYFAYRGKDFSDKEENEIFNMDKRETYKNNKDLAYNIATVSIISATVIYAYNIYDAITSKGEPRFTLQKKSLPFDIVFNNKQVQMIWSF